MASLQFFYMIFFVSLKPLIENTVYLLHFLHRVFGVTGVSDFAILRDVLSLSHFIRKAEAFSELTIKLHSASDCMTKAMVRDHP